MSHIKKFLVVLISSLPLIACDEVELNLPEEQQEQVTEVEDIARNSASCLNIASGNTFFTKTAPITETINYDKQDVSPGDDVIINGESSKIIKRPFRDVLNKKTYFIQYPEDVLYIENVYAISEEASCDNIMFDSFKGLIGLNTTSYFSSNYNTSSNIQLFIKLGRTVVEFSSYIYEAKNSTFTAIDGDYDLTDNITAEQMDIDTAGLILKADELIDYIQVGEL